MNFLSSEYKEPHSPKTFDFSKFNNGSASTTPDKNNHKFGSFSNYSSEDEDNPIQADSNFLFNNGDSIIFDINKKNDDKA